MQKIHFVYLILLIFCAYSTRMRLEFQFAVNQSSAHRLLITNEFQVMEDDEEF